MEGTLRIIQDTSNHPRLLQPWPTWPWTLWDHIYLTKCEELSQKKTKKNEAAARSQLVTVTKWTLFPKNPPDFEFAAFHSLTPTPQEQQLLQHSYKNTRAEFQPKTRNGFNPEKLLFFTFFFFFQDTAWHLLKSALKSAWVSDPALGTKISMPVCNGALGSDRCCRGHGPNCPATAQGNVPLHSQMDNGEHWQIFSL